jgi:hypothetical protein
MAVEIQIMIPQYGELNRIYSDFIISHTFSFDKQKFITDFYKQYNDTTAFEAAILELVLDKHKEQYTLILNSLRTEIEKNILIYEKHPLFDDEIISRVCYNFAGRYDTDIEAQLRVTQKLSKPLNEAYNRYDSIGYREHTAEEEKQAEKSMNAARLNTTRKRRNWTNSMNCKSRQERGFSIYGKPFDNVYRLSILFMEILKKYLPDDVKEKRPEESVEQNAQEEVQNTPEEQHEYFDMKPLSPIHGTCVGEQFEAITIADFYANINLYPCKNKLKIKAREKIRVCYLIFLMSEKLSKQYRDEWRDKILKLLDIDESYYRSKYKEPVSDFPSDSNQKFAKEMESIFR